jgi:hypothetical protein
MTQLIVEGFATYGTVAYPGNNAVYNALLSGAWADIPANGGYSIGQLPFGNDPALYFTTRTNQRASPNYEMRRILPGGARDELITSMRFVAYTLPSESGPNGIISFRTANNVMNCRLVLEPNGDLSLTTGAGLSTITLIRTQTPVIVAETPIHLEMWIKASTGAFTLYANGVQIMTGTGLAFATNNPIGMFVLCSSETTGSGSTSSISFAFADLILRDTAGVYNNAITGDRRVATLFVSSDDVANQGWTPRPLTKFGVGVLQNIAQTSGCVTAAQSTDFDFGTGDFTIEGFFRFASLPTGANRATIAEKWTDTTNNRAWRLYKGGPGLNGGNTRFEISTNGQAGTVVAVIDWPWVPEVNLWYHLAVVRASGNTMFFVNGVMQGLPIADANAYFAAASSTALLAAFPGAQAANTALPGWQDEFRVTKGVARYTANFVPPAAAFPRSVGGDPNFASVTWLSGWDSGVADESSFARTLTARFGADYFLPADAPQAYKVLNKPTPQDYSFIEAALLNASGLFTQTANPANAETVRVGTKDGAVAATYTFKTALASAYDVLIGANVAATMANLVAAINQDAGAGVTYGTGTLANFDVSAVRLPSNQLQATANIAGTAGNSIVTTDTAVNGSWGSGTLTGGANIPPYSQFGYQRPPLKTTIIDSVTVVSRAWKTDSGPATLQQSLVGPGGTAALGVPKPLGTSPSLYFDMYETDPDTAAPLTPSTLVGGKVRVNRTA